MKTLVICGPTASGKTELAVRLAKKTGGEVISADCMLVYRGLDIGTAKPAESEKEGVPHHMIDIADPCDSYSVSEYTETAGTILKGLLEKGRQPVVCGGTGFYITSLLFPRQNGNTAADPALRGELYRFAEENGNHRLWERLKEADPESAGKLHENDIRRVVRALEIVYTTGRKKSEQNDGRTPVFDYAAFAFDYPREVLYDRINRRTDAMLKAGLIEETDRLLRGGVPENAQCMQGIGYKETCLYLKNEIDYGTLRDIIAKNTRNYAKRQITFFHHQVPGIVWLDPERAAENERIILESVCGTSESL